MLDTNKYPTYILSIVSDGRCQLSFAIRIEPRNKIIQNTMTPEYAKISNIVSAFCGNFPDRMVSLIF